MRCVVYNADLFYAEQDDVVRELMDKSGPTRRLVMARVNRAAQQIFAANGWTWGGYAHWHVPEGDGALGLKDRWSKTAKQGGPAIVTVVGEKDVTLVAPLVEADGNDQKTE